MKGRTLCRPKVTLGKTYRLFEIVSFSVFLREGESLGGDIGGLDLGGAQFEGKGESNDAAAGADVEDGRSLELLILCDGKFDELLSFWSRNEGAPVRGEEAPVELDASEKVL